MTQNYPQPFKLSVYTFIFTKISLLVHLFFPLFIDRARAHIILWLQQISYSVYTYARHSQIFGCSAGHFLFS